MVLVIPSACVVVLLSSSSSFFFLFSSSLSVCLTIFSSVLSSSSSCSFLSSSLAALAFCVMVAVKAVSSCSRRTSANFVSEIFVWWNCSFMFVSSGMSALQSTQIRSPLGIVPLFLHSCRKAKWLFDLARLLFVLLYSCRKPSNDSSWFLWCG